MWVIDPLDGTTNFAHTNPVCCVSIGLVDGEAGRPVLGGIYDPFRDELFVAERKKGATMNGRRIRVSRTGNLEEALLVTGFPYDRQQHAEFYTKLYAEFMRRCHDVRRSGSAALDLAWVSCGRLDGYWEFKLNPWDVAAGRLLVEEAGGKVSDFSNRPWASLADFGKQTLATNGRIHARMLKLLPPK
jgi:myo-inositol-1(or 4)-monophosphatase